MNGNCGANKPDISPDSYDDVDLANVLRTDDDNMRKAKTDDKSQPVIDPLG